MAATQSAQWCSPSADVNFTIGFLTQDFIDHDSRREGSSNQALDPSDRSPSLQQRLQELQGPLVGDTRGNATSESLPLIRYLAEISLELSSHSLQIQQLRSALERSGNTPDGESAQSEVATPIDVFLDCVSSLPDVECKTPLERIEQDFSGSPNPYLESSPFFYPEQYTLEDLFNDRLSVHAMIQSEEDERIQKLFITYAQARQGWRRVVVSAAFQKKSTYPEFQCSVHGDQELWPQTLPKAVFKILNDLLSGLDLYASITHLSLPLSEDQTGGLVVDLDGVRTFQDDREVALCHEGQILQDIEDMNCTVFLESEIVVRSRNSVSRFMVCVDSQTCMERKAPFASAAARGGNSFQEFCDDLKRLLQLRCCRNVIQFIGVVLDDTRKHLRCYLYEYPNYNIQQIFESASSLSSTVSWNVRETWAQQIITAIAEVHETGMVVGLGELATINIRADGSAVLAGGTTSTWRTVTKLHGYQAPELRRSGKDAVPDIPTHSTLTSIVSTSDASTSIALSSKAANNAITTTTSAQAVSSTPPAADGVGKSESTTPTNFRTDMFTLGMILWQLAEHRAGLCRYLCLRNDCTQIPRYACRAPHTNPIELPGCRLGIPDYFHEMIRKCRAANPKARPSARQLLELFPDTTRHGSTPLELKNIAEMFPPIRRGCVVYCDECGSLTTFDHYHCTICNEDDLDFCPACVDRGIHCYDSQHQLIRRGSQSGS